MYNQSRKNSARNSDKHSPLRTKSSGLRDDNTVDSQVLKTNLQEFYKNSKEKLMHLKKETEIVETDNERTKDENNKLNIKYSQLKGYNDELQLRLKGMKEKLISANKNKTFLQTQIKDLKRETDATSREIDCIKIDNSYKVKMIQNDIEHTTVVKESNVKSIRKKIENEEVYQQNLKEKTAEIKAEINRYKELIQELNQQDNNRNKQLLKETAEMTKFLSEL